MTAAKNTCPGEGVGTHEGHSAFCRDCIEAKPPERPNEPTWLDLHAPDPADWVPDIMSRWDD